MEGLRNYQAAQSGFAGAAEEMNENAAAFRGKVSNIKNENKSLVEQFQTATDMNALRGLGEEAAVRAFKTYGGKALGWVDKKAFGGRIGSDTKYVKDLLKQKAKNIYQEGKERITGQREDAPEEGGETEMTEMGGGRDERGEQLEDGEPAERETLEEEPSQASQPERGKEGEGIGDEEEPDIPEEDEGEGQGEVEETDPYEYTDYGGGDDMPTADADDLGNYDEFSGETTGTGQGMEMTETQKGRLKRLMGDDDEETKEGDDGFEDMGEGEEGTEPMNFDDFMEQFNNTPMTETGEIDLDRAGEQLHMLDEDIQGHRRRQAEEEQGDENEQQQQEQQEQDEGADEREAGDEEGTKEDAPEEETKEGDEDDEEPDDPDETGDLGDAAEDLGEDVGEGVGEAVGEEGAVAGLEGAGAALDLTGIGAVVGIPLQIAGAVLEGAAIIQAGKSVVDWFESDILGNKPKVPQVKLPKATASMAQEGLIAAPVYDNSMDTPSTAAAF